MKDRWINTGSDEEELKPFIEPDLDISDKKRMGTLCLHTVYSTHSTSTQVVYSPVRNLTGCKQSGEQPIRREDVVMCCLCVSDLMVGMGYSSEQINDSLAKMKYDDITATYLLLGRKAAEVRGGCHGNAQ